MTITQDTSAPLVAVVGATGIQGGSVINALAESDRPYRIRGFTRDTNKETAQRLTKQGVEMLSVNLTVENKVQVFKAFQGAAFAFTMTNYWEHMSGPREVAEGKMLIDAASAAKVRLVIWSGLSSVVKNTNGKYTAPHFDGKEEVTEYAKSLGGVPVVDVQAGVYMQNFKSMMAPKKRSDGSFAIIGVGPAETTYPLIDAERDYGLFVRKAIESPTSYPAFSAIYAYGEKISKGQIAKVLSQATGKEVRYVELNEDQLVEHFRKEGTPEPGVQAIRGVYFGLLEAGYFGNNDIAPSRQGLPRATRTWTEFVAAEEWDKVLV
ncbi:hypothetical protein FRB94_003057 [Tulasnella sp. JGI-2019a]|nr:hypothetical protein FRB94_003057 [Tulasnella sp. JGI-2019a]KAG9005308.1 hypothetical protein FRB93_009862 [Tulasnella sp. JGI-2019a]KAG9027609.1 hypothetical protein FRB95_007571 [Tulasnella sp. JGI-2019a]